MKTQTKEYKTLYKNARRRAEKNAAIVAQYRETFKAFDYCLECERWSLNTEFEHAPDCVNAEEGKNDK